MVGEIVIRKIKRKEDKYSEPLRYPITGKYEIPSSQYFHGLPLLGSMPTILYVY